MSLLSCKDARPWARSIREKVLTHEMPPWHADPHYGLFVNDRRLSQTEIDTISKWVEQGAPEGETKDLPPAPVFEDGWNIGKPDLVLRMPE
ncbi:MAG TPA: thiol-disulfide isomerase, partial [Blastocatellia bacterium]|nr:thiol-disulfide isomerase [Blastocatellia bacterium]